MLVSLHCCAGVQVTGCLTPVEVSLLSAKLAELELCLEPGLVRLNWNNRGIDAFVATTTKAIQEFQALHHSVQKNSAVIEKQVSHMASSKLVADPSAGAVYILCSQYGAESAGLLLQLAYLMHSIASS